MLRAILIDDSPTFLVAFGELLRTFPGVQVVATLNDGKEGLRAAAELAPDIVFVDMVMPGTNGMGMRSGISSINRSMDVQPSYFRNQRGIRDANGSSADFALPGGCG